jgi:hypothetical protein
VILAGLFFLSGGTDMKLILAVILAFTSCAFGQTTSSKPPLTAIAIDWTYDPQPKTLHLHLANNSNKDITAYSIAISTKYADGSADTNVDGTPAFLSAFGTDMLGGLINFQLASTSQEPQHGNGTFAAGTSQYHDISETKDVSGITTVVEMVTYADATADVKNEQAFRRMMARRKGELLAMEKVDEVIKRALATSTDTPISAALAELTPLFVDVVGKSHSPEDPEGNQESELRMAVSSLQQMQQSKRATTTEREYLTRYVEEQEKRIALMAPHCEIAK